MIVQLQLWSLYLLQETISFDPRSMWNQMGTLAKLVVVLLFIMSAYSIGVMIDRVMAYSAARKQSRAFAPAVAGALREGKLDEAVKIADRYKKSHLAKVVVAGLQEFHRTPQSSVPDNVREGASSKLCLGGFIRRKVPQKIYRPAGNVRVRVKRCGKSAPLSQ
jgi:hypothetical protein